MRAIYLFGPLICLLVSSLRGAWGDEKPVNVNNKSIETFLDSVPADHGVMMEFYAHWCPACQHFAPEYEKVARYFNAEPKVTPEIIVARIDCADETALCGRFSIGRYPTMKYGLPSAFKEGHSDQLQDYPDQRVAKDIVSWLGTQKGVKYNYNASQVAQNDRSAVKATVLGTNSATPVATEADLHDIEKATALAIKYAIQTPQLLEQNASRANFKELFDLLTKAHPIDRCRVGALKLSKALPQAWIEGTSQAAPDLSTIHVCGADADQKDWRMCKGSKEGKRGYTCGLWALLHSLSVRALPEDNGGAVWMSAIRGFVANFFQCSDCASHFGEMAAEQAAKDVTTRKEGVMWMWSAHNEVNRRLETEERISGDSDPAFPKAQWPTTELCPLCRLPSLNKDEGIMWNRDEVYRFLLKFYHGEPESNWAKKVKAGKEALLLSGRKSMPGNTGSSKHHSHVGRYLLLVLVACVLLLFLRQRSQRTTRKIVSL